VSAVTLAAGVDGVFDRQPLKAPAASTPASTTVERYRLKLRTLG
jgi:hypothetical protein